MKKLGKLTISLNKVIKNEELVNLRGGYDDGGGQGNSCTCTCFDAQAFMEDPEAPLECVGYLYTPFGNCVDECAEFYGLQYTGECGNNSLCL